MTPSSPRPTAHRKPATRRRSGMSVEVVVAAAVEVLDESGVEELSMRRVAERLGTGAASLYAYVASKDELLELVYDELVGKVALPEPDPERWREQVQQMLRDLHQVLVAHRGSALTGLGRIPTTPKTLRAADALVAVLRAGGLSDRVAALGLDQLLLFVCADAFEDGLLEGAGMSQAEIVTYYQDVHGFYSTLSPQLYPALVAVAPDMVDPQIDRFGFGLSLMIAGLETVNAGEQ